MNQPSRTAATPADQARPPAPRPVILAVRLMYAGAALTAAGTLISVIALTTGGTAALKTSYPRQNATQLHHTLTTLITAAVLSSLIEIAIWLVIARANRGGLSWARIAACVLFALSTWNLVAHLHGPIAIANLIYTALIWLVGLGAVVLLWHRESSAYIGTIMSQIAGSRGTGLKASRSGSRGKTPR